MVFKRNIWFGLFLLLLTACTAVPSPELVVELPAQPQVLQVGITPALAHYTEPVQNCSDVSVLVEELPWLRLQEMDKDLMLVFGEDGKVLTNDVYQLSQTELVFIVHPDLPYDALSFSQVKAIYQGEMTDWSDVAMTSSYAGTIQPWGYMEETEIMGPILSVLDVTETSGQWFVVPGPAEMVEKVSQEQNAIGLVPAYAVTDGVKVLSIPDAVFDPVPILAIWSAEPSDAQQDWLLCVQEAMQ